MKETKLKIHKYRSSGLPFSRISYKLQIWEKKPKTSIEQDLSSSLYVIELNIGTILNKQISKKKKTQQR